MIHVLNYSENIIDDLSFKQDAIYDANHTINIQETMETFDFEVSSKIAQNLRDRHRLLIQDHMGIYREFIIENIIDLESGVTEVQSNASYLEDIRTAKPVKPHSFKDQPPTVMMDYLLADTGWEVSPETEVPMNTDFSWDKVTDRLELLKELQDVFNMRLLFYVEVGKNNVEKRYVKLVEVNPIFNGEEIDYKENLIGLKREIDYSEVVTALLGVGPEDSETKKRIYVEVTDDKAQEQFGLPQRYIWDYYEVQVDSETEVNAGLIREETINELERRKKAVVTYDISSTDINAQVGDMIRVKDEDFNPEIYLEAEIVEIHYNLLNNIKEYKFGILKEFIREQVYSQYDKFRKELEERLKEIISNTDSIISERLEEELKYVERYIEKSPTPPPTPKEGDLWLDTTDPKVAILKRYENGKWIKSSVDHVSQIGGLTREETMYETLKERLYRIENSYSEAFKRHDALVTEKHYHYVKDDIKNNLNIKLNGLKNSYDDFKIAFNNINSEQPTIGLITTAISRAVEFEAKLKEYNDSYYVARKEFDEVIALLQSQYSDEKFNEAIEEVAKAIGGVIDENGNIDTSEIDEQRLNEAMELVANAIGGTWNGSQLIADIPNKQELEDLNTSIRQFLNGEISTLDENLGKKIETVVNQAKDEFSVAIDSVDKKILSMESDMNDLSVDIGNNFVSFGTYISENSSRLNVLEDEIILKANSTEVTQQLNDALKPIKSNVQTNQAELKVQAGLIASKVDSSTYETDKDGIINDITATKSEVKQLSDSFTVEIDSVNKKFLSMGEGISGGLESLATYISENSSRLNVLEDEIILKVNSSEVVQQLNDALNPIKSDIQTNNAELLLQKNLIEQRVTKTDYTTDMSGVVTRLNTSEGKIINLENEIKLKVTETDVQNKIDDVQIGGRNLVLNSDDLNERSRASGITTTKVDDGIYKNVLKVNNPNLASYITIHADNYASYPSPNKDFTVSFLVKGKTGTGKEPKLSLYYNAESGYQEYPQEVSENEYRWISLTYNLSKTAPNNHIGVGNFSELHIARMKVEHGNKATDWTPAPEDITKYTDNRVDNLQIGGRNLIPKSDFRAVSEPPPEWTAWGNSDTGVYINQRTLNTRLLVQTANPPTNTSRDRFGLVTPYFTEWLVQGEEYVLTWLASTSVNFEGFRYIYLMETDEGNIGLGTHGELSEIEHNVRRPEEPNRSYTRYQFKFTSPYSGKSKVMFGGWYPAGTYTWFYFAEPTLVKGNKTKDWTPAPEDMEDRITTAEGSITVNSDAIKQKVSYEEINKTNKTLERVISELIVDARGISYQYDVNGMISGFTLNNQYFKLNHNLIDINNGDVVIQNGKTTIKQAVINSGHIKELSFDKLKGGTATFGGSGQNGALEVYDVNDTPIMKLDYEQMSVSELALGTLNAEEINSPSVVSVLNVDRLYKINRTKYASYLEPTLIEEIVEGDGGEEEGGTGTVKEVWACSTLKPCVQHTPKHLNGTSVHYEISGGAQDDDTIDISGFSGGYKSVVDVRFEDSNTYWYYFVIKGNSVPVRLLGVNSNKPKIVSSESYAGVSIWGSSYVILNSIHLNGRNDTKYGVRISHASNMYIVHCIVESFEMGIFANELARVYCDVTKGHNSVNGFRFTSGSILSGQGTAPESALTGGTNGISKTGGAYVWGTWNYPTNTKPVEPAPPPAKPKRYTKVWETSSARTFYRNQPNAYTVTFMRDYPIQGNWGDGFGFRDGAWYFGTGMRNTLKGKKIIRVRVSIGRSSTNSQGYTGSRKFSLRMHQSANKPASNNNTNPTFGSGVYTGYLAFGERKWFDVTSTFGPSMANGNWYGFGVKTDSSSKYEYMALAKNIKVEVVYE